MGEEGEKSSVSVGGGIHQGHPNRTAVWVLLSDADDSESESSGL